MKFFTFHQNNSFGRYVTDAKVTFNVIIEAGNASHAKMLAEQIGIYFNGCRDGRDCPCCGDRWYEPWDEGDDVPNIYGTLITEDHKLNLEYVAPIKEDRAAHVYVYRYPPNEPEAWEEV